MLTENVLRQTLQQVFKLVSFSMATSPKTCFLYINNGLLQARPELSGAASVDAHHSHCCT